MRMQCTAAPFISTYWLLVALTYSLRERMLCLMSTLYMRVNNEAYLWRAHNIAIQWKVLSFRIPAHSKCSDCFMQQSRMLQCKLCCDAS